MNDNPFLQYLSVDGTDIAVRHREGRPGPGLVWLCGYHADMEGTKALRVDAIAAETGCSCLRFDYSGHGSSKGKFIDGTVSRWLKESLAVYNQFTKGEQILIGSSMGAWIALRMAQELTKRGNPPQALVLIAPAPDFTHDLIEPVLTNEQKADLNNKGYFLSGNGEHAIPTTKALIEDGRRNLVLTEPIAINCPVTILQGMEDKEVPYQQALKLVHHLPAHDVTLTFIRDGDHRLSRVNDLDLLEKVVKNVIERT